MEEHLDIQDFERAFGVSKAHIPNYLNKVISQGEIVKNSLIKRGNKECFERIYYYEGKHYVVTGIGTNGFIVSAYFIDIFHLSFSGMKSIFNFFIIVGKDSL